MHLKTQFALFFLVACATTHSTPEESFAALQADRSPSRGSLTALVEHLDGPHAAQSLELLSSLPGASGGTAMQDVLQDESLCPTAVQTLLRRYPDLPPELRGGVLQVAQDQRCAEVDSWLWDTWTNPDFPAELQGEIDPWLLSRTDGDQRLIELVAAQDQPLEKRTAALRVLSARSLSPEVRVALAGATGDLPLEEAEQDDLISTVFQPSLEESVIAEIAWNPAAPSFLRRQAFSEVPRERFSALFDSRELTPTDQVFLAEVLGTLEDLEQAAASRATKKVFADLPAPQAALIVRSELAPESLRSRALDLLLPDEGRPLPLPPLERSATLRTATSRADALAHRVAQFAFEDGMSEDRQAACLGALDSGLPALTEELESSASHADPYTRMACDGVVEVIGPGGDDPDRMLVLLESTDRAGTLRAGAARKLIGLQQDLDGRLRAIRAMGSTEVAGHLSDSDLAAGAVHAFDAEPTPTPAQLAELAIDSTLDERVRAPALVAIEAPVQRSMVLEAAARDGVLDAVEHARTGMAEDREAVCVGLASRWLEGDAEPDEDGLALALSAYSGADPYQRSACAVAIAMDDGPASRCSEGRVISVATEGHCCWPGQHWQYATCMGEAQCPEGFRGENNCIRDGSAVRDASPSGTATRTEWAGDLIEKAGRGGGGKVEGLTVGIVSAYGCADGELSQGQSYDECGGEMATGYSGLGPEIGYRKPRMDLRLSVKAAPGGWHPLMMQGRAVFGRSTRAGLKAFWWNPIPQSRNAGPGSGGRTLMAGPYGQVGLGLSTSMDAYLGLGLMLPIAGDFATGMPRMGQAFDLSWGLRWSKQHWFVEPEGVLRYDLEYSSTAYLFLFDVGYKL